MSVPPDLVAAYRAAVYEVDDGERALSFQVEKACPALDDLLRDREAHSAVLMTAYNPRSRRQTAKENTDAHRAFLGEVARLGHESLPSRGRDPEGQWPAEPGLLIFDLSEGVGLALCRRFDQYAFVWIERGHVPRLVFAA